jgi:hypothetical protein
MVEAPEKSIADKLLEILGNDSSTVAPYTSVQEPTSSVVEPVPTTPVNNIEPRNIEDSTPITVNTEIEDNTKEEAEHVPSNPIASVKPPTIEPVNTPIIKEVPVPVIQDNNIPIDTIIEEITSNLQDTLSKQQIPAPELPKVDTNTIQPTENKKVTTELYTPTVDNIVDKISNEFQPPVKPLPVDSIVNKISNEVQTTAKDTSVDSIIDKISNVPQIPVKLPTVDSIIDKISNETQTPLTAPKTDNIIDKISNEYQSPVKASNADNIIDKISNEYQSSKKEELPTSKIEPTVPNTENITPTPLQPSQINSTVEPNNESTLNNVPLDNPKFDIIADNTNQTNKLLENLTKAMYMFAASKGDNTPAMPPIPVQVPSSAPTSSLNAVPESVNATYSGMIPTIRSRFV